MSQSNTATVERLVELRARVEAYEVEAQAAMAQLVRAKSELANAVALFVGSDVAATVARGPRQRAKAQPGDPRLAAPIWALARKALLDLGRAATTREIATAIYGEFRRERYVQIHNCLANAHRRGEAVKAVVDGAAFYSLPAAASEAA